jgi:hypothetical protein
MRFRTLLTALTTLLTSAALVAAPAPAHAGPANYCRDNLGGAGVIDVPVLDWPITIGIEIYNDPTNTAFQQVRVCFSDMPYGQPGRLVGGSVGVGIGTDTGTVTPGGLVYLTCNPDLAGTGIFPSCYLPVGANVGANELRVDTPASSICLVSIGSGCVAYVPGVMVRTDYDPNHALLGVNLLGFGTSVTLPAPNCIAVIVACP